jgi:hypothetical protein
LKLSQDDIKPYLSSYLNGGWKQDELILTSVEYDKDWICGNLQVVKWFLPSDGLFHFTVPLAFIWIAQLAIIKVCIDHGLKEKPGEIYLREVNIKCNRTIKKTDDIAVLLTLQSKRYVGNQVYYIGTIDVDDNAFSGIGKFISPLPLDHSLKGFYSEK